MKCPLQGAGWALLSGFVGGPFRVAPPHVRIKTGSNFYHLRRISRTAWQQPPLRPPTPCRPTRISGSFQPTLDCYCQE